MLSYNTNHLGSVLGLLGAQGKTGDYRYAGMYYHASTRLYLTLY